jgi:hypothetical protein
VYHLLFLIWVSSCYHKLLQTGRFKPQTVVEAGFSRSRCQSVWFLGEGSLLDSQKAGFSLCPHMVERVSSLSYKGTNSIMGGPHLMTSSKPNYFQRLHLQISSHWGS